MNHAGASSDIDRSLCEILLQLLTDSLGLMNKTPNDAFRFLENQFFLIENESFFLNFLVFMNL